MSKAPSKQDLFYLCKNTYDVKQYFDVNQRFTSSNRIIAQSSLRVRRDLREAAAAVCSASTSSILLVAISIHNNSPMNHLALSSNLWPGNEGLWFIPSETAGLESHNTNQNQGDFICRGVAFEKRGIRNGTQTSENIQRTSASVICNVTIKNTREYWAELHVFTYLHNPDLRINGKTKSLSKSIRLASDLPSVPWDR